MFRVHVLSLLHSTNDVLVFETAAAGTSFTAESKARAALETLVDGNRWMINLNVGTQVSAWISCPSKKLNGYFKVLHWDLASLSHNYC